MESIQNDITPLVKTSDELEELISRAETDGYYIIPDMSLITTPVTNLGQRLIECHINEENNIVMRLHVPLQYIGLMIKHNLNDILDMLNRSDELGITNISCLKFMILDNIQNELPEFRSKLFKRNTCLYHTRLFGAGDRYSKVTDIAERNALIARLPVTETGNNYPDQEHNTIYKFPLIFYIKQTVQCSQLHNSEFKFNIDNIRILLSNLESINKFDLCENIVDIFMKNPQTSELIRYHEFRKYASDTTKSIAFQFELIREQMCGIDMWNDNFKPWKLDDIQDIPYSQERSWFVDQIKGWRSLIYIHYGSRHSTRYIIPNNNRATKEFNKFSYNLLNLPQELLNEFFDNNLVIGGSAFAYSACAIKYNNTTDTQINMLDRYSDSDIDCIIMSGDNIFIADDELEFIVSIKMEILKNYYPDEWNFRIVQKNKRFLIQNDYVPNRILEFYSVPYSKTTVWKHFSKYHFGCVRGYFDGSTWYILPSAVISILSRFLIDIRYCATKHPPQKLIFKYIQRGFRPILNTMELRELRSYARDTQHVSLPFYGYRSMQPYF
jgi:hypothetical protein